MPCRAELLCETHSEFTSALGNGGCEPGLSLPASSSELGGFGQVMSQSSEELSNPRLLLGGWRALGCWGLAGL